MKRSIDLSDQLSVQLSAGPAGVQVSTEPGQAPHVVARHGMTSIGYWVVAEHPGTLVYLLSHDDPRSAAASWEAFRSDPEWQMVKAESEKDGPVVQSVTASFLEPTDFSALG